MEPRNLSQKRSNGLNAYSSLNFSGTFSIVFLRSGTFRASESEVEEFLIFEVFELSFFENYVSWKLFSEVSPLFSSL